MIRLENTHKEFKTNFKSTKILNNLSLFIQKGSWVSIVGPSGTGKSTLLKVISGLLPPDSGVVSFNNVDIYQLSDSKSSELRKKHIGFVFQDFKLLPYYSVLDNVIMPVYDDLKKEKKPIYTRAKELLQMVGIQESIHNRLPEELSGGEKQRVAIARALIANPDVLICDEPTGNLDWENRNQIIELLILLKGEGKTIILVTHDMEAALHGDVVYQLLQGALTSDGVLL